MKNQNDDFSLSYKLKWMWYYFTKTKKGQFEARHFIQVFLLITFGSLLLDLIIGYICHIK